MIEWIQEWICSCGVFGCLLCSRVDGGLFEGHHPASTVISDPVLGEDAVSAPWSHLRWNLPHCHRGLHSLPGLLPEPPAGVLPLLRGAGGGHAHPGALLGHEQQERLKLQPPGLRPRLSTLPLRLPKLRKPRTLHPPRRPLPRIPVCVPAQVGKKKQSHHLSFWWMLGKVGKDIYELTTDSPPGEIILYLILF